MARLSLRDDQFERIAALLPGKASDPGCTAGNNRMFVEAVLWIARTGSPWRDLPAEFGPWNSVYQRFARWSRRGVWHRIFALLAQDADFEEAFIDSTIVRAHQHAAGAPKKKGDQALGRSRGGLSTKIHALVEGLGSLARFHLTGGEAGDSPEALTLLGDLRPDSLSADKAYDTDAILEHLADRGIQAVIPPRSHRSSNGLLIGTCTRTAIWSSGSSAVSSNSDASPLAMTSSLSASLPSSLWPPPSYGSPDCQQTLGTREKLLWLVR